MVTHINRAKTIIANIKSKDAVVPGNPFLFKMVHAFVRAYPSQWIANLGRQPTPLVINPDNLSDPLDIGTLDDSDPPVFTPAVNGVKNTALASHYNGMQREYNKAILVADLKKQDTIVAGDAGKTPEEVAEEHRVEAIAETKANLGDPDNDPEV
jgi:hypothetical protein|tara:strand:+ start:183 stop:644 length:462 start_codon:yes stop_codon:yes gene_type:complete